MNGYETPESDEREAPSERTSQTEDVGPPKSRRWVTVTCGVLFAGTVAGLLLQSNRQQLPEPISEMQEVFYITADEWTDFVFNQRPSGIGWVLLPEPVAGDEFHSGVDPYERGYLEAKVCRECHRARYEGFLKTAHHRTASLPSSQTILGSFEAGRNILLTRNPDLHFEMVQKEDGFYQDLHVASESGRYLLSEQFGIVIGSGNHGQGYLYWKGDQLCQMHVSYFTAVEGWTNGPGFYIDGTADFSRPITSRCLECHATWFSRMPNTVNRYDKRNYVLGVSCVRCHGPGREHVEHHRAFPDDDQGRKIVNPAGLSRERMNEVCAQCHSGAGEPIRPAFTYRPGDPLAKHIKLNMSSAGSENDDPHAANQLARLKKSSCYQNSDEMTCTTCHKPHRHERGQFKRFSRRCAQCHAIDDCHLTSELGTRVEDHCVQCHMPTRRDAKVLVQERAGTAMPLLRDHYIRVWPDVSDQIRRKILAESASAGDGRESTELKH